MVTDKVNSFIGTNIGLPQCLTGLSMKEWKILRDNSISLQVLVFEDKEVVYANVHYGGNIKYSNLCSTYNGNVIRWKEINLEQMKGRCRF